MNFFDRIVLAKYDTNAMIAATTAANIAFVFQFGAMSIAMIAEVFVGQYNGAKQFKNVGKPVWQMIWFALLSALIMIPLGLFASSVFIPSTLAVDGEPYFKWIMIFGPSYPLVGALSAFFVGRGQVKAVTLSVIFANILNLILVLTLVFGIENIIPALGAKGAAIATGLAETTVAVGLFCLFLSASNRKHYHTHLWQFDKAIFVKCLKLGFPNAIGHMAATAAWAGVLILLAERGLDHVTVMSIGLSIWMLFSFITEGLQKGVTAIASNHIGAKRWDLVSKVLMSGLRLHFTLALILGIPLVLMPEFLVGFFIPMNDSATDVAHLRELVELSCRWLWLAFVFDGMAWVIDGILTAGGDTRFIMLMNSLGTWLFCIAPIYFFVVKMEGTPIMTLQWVTVFCLILFSSYYFRYKSKKWKKNSLI
jgi:MATE family multidrug resistance protein